MHQLPAAAGQTLACISSTLWSAGATPSRHAVSSTTATCEALGAPTPTHHTQRTTRGSPALTACCSEYRESKLKLRAQQQECRAVPKAAGGYRCQPLVRFARVDLTASTTTASYLLLSLPHPSPHPFRLRGTCDTHLRLIDSWTIFRTVGPHLKQRSGRCTSDSSACRSPNSPQV